MSNRAIVQDGFNKENPLSTLKLVTRPIPSAGANQVVVRVTARPINPADFFCVRNGAVGGNGIIGSEGCGVVHEVGKGVTAVQEGQRVVTIIGTQVYQGNGSFQEYILLDASLVWPVPDDMTDEQAAQAVINPWTTYSMLHDLQIPKGEYVIQSAAGSTLGKQVISLAKHWGIKTINIVRRPEQKAELRALGADEVICSTEEDAVARVKEITAGKLAWGALDAVSGSMTATLASSVRDGGQVFVYGVMGGMTASIGMPDLWRHVEIRSWTIYDKILPSVEKSHAVASAVTPLTVSGAIPVAECERWALEDFEKAMEVAEKSAGAKKVLLISP